MRIAIYSVFLALLSFGCKTVKERKVKSVFDSTARQSAYVDSNTVLHRVELKDSAVVIPFARVSGVVSLSDLLPNYTAQGKPVVNRIEVRKGNLKTFIAVMPDSTIEYGAEFDSLVLIVKNLYREISVLKSVQKSSEKLEAVRRSERMEWREVMPFIERYGPWVLLVLMIILFLPKSKK
jgi:hypothetical protein